MQSIEGFQFIVSLFVFPLLFLSSPFSTLQASPELLRNIAFIDPITYGIDGLRATLIGYSYFPIYIDLAVLIFLSVLTMSLGSYFFSKSEV
jgi:ABC-2 type transport system permease protein